jgi:hypothetical protein
MSKSPYVMAVCCWRADHEADAWAQFRRIAEIGAAAWPNRPATLTEPPDIPWLAVNVLPHAMWLPPATMPVLGDIERCFAWALIALRQAQEQIDPAHGSRHRLPCSPQEASGAVATCGATSLPQAAAVLAPARPTKS